jgi:hypothetical protein
MKIFGEVCEKIVLWAMCKGERKVVKYSIVSMAVVFGILFGMYIYVYTIDKEPYRKKAQEALDKIMSGVSFAEVCQEYTTDAEIKKTNGFIKNYITSFLVKNQSVAVNANKSQGYWAFESIAGVQTGQSPSGSTTVPNPLASTSPIPAGSCVVTGQFANPFSITGNEKNDITVIMSLSINKSFEWKDLNGNGKWDVDPGSGEDVVDMGLRGLIPIVQ